MCFSVHPQKRKCWKFRIAVSAKAPFRSAVGDCKPAKEQAFPSHFVYVELSDQRSLNRVRIVESVRRVRRYGQRGNVLLPQKLLLVLTEVNRDAVIGSFQLMVEGQLQLEFAVFRNKRFSDESIAEMVQRHAILRADVDAKIEFRIGWDIFQMKLNSCFDPLPAMRYSPFQGGELVR